MRPEGFAYRSEFISKEDERSLIANVEHLPFNEVRMHGVVARRMTIARYPPDAAIGWHRDAPMFGSPVIGVSLASSTRAARTQWQHSIPRTKELRYSITMRTVRRKND